MLVGRDREQMVLNEVLASARAAQGRVLAIVGEPGIGKSAMLAYAEEHAGGMNVLRARGVQSEVQIPFAGLFDLLRPALPVIDRIPRPQAEALEGALALRPARREDRFAIGAATLGLLAAYAEASPLLVLVDDAHWLDGSSATALLFAARRLAADPIALVLAVREGEQSLLDGAGFPSLSLVGLDLVASVELLRNHATRPAQHHDVEEIAHRLHRETGGNPLALLELAAEAHGFKGTAVNEPLPVSTSVGNAFAQRSRSLEVGARRVLALIAASDGGDLAVLARAASSLGLSIDDLAPGESSGLVTVHAGRVGWTHPLARSAIYADSPAAERRAAHRALADALPDADSDRRAWHLALAALGPDDAASSALEQAGIRARERSAYDVASRAFERAATLSASRARRGHLLYAAADCAWLGGLGPRTTALLDEATDYADEPEILSFIGHLRGQVAVRSGHIAEGRSILVAAAEQAVAVDPPRAVVTLSEAVVAGLYAGDAGSMRQIAERLSEVAGACNDERSRFFATISTGMALVLSGDGDRGAALIRNAVALLEHYSEELGDDPFLLAWAAMGPLWLREASGQALVDRAFAVARSRSAVGALPRLLNYTALYRAVGNRWLDAEAMFYEAIQLARESGQDTELTTSLARLAWLEARQGKEAQCRAHATEALELSTAFGLGLCEVWVLSALGDLELGLGHAEAALAFFEQQQALLRHRAINDVDLSPAPELVEVYLRLGRPEPAAEAVAVYGREAALKGLPWARARAARARGLVAKDDQIDACFGEAIDFHEAAPDDFEAARTHLAYGSRLRRSRQRVRAREELRAAVDAFDRLGAEPWSDFARAELAATGETVRRRDPTTLHQLTPQELQIAMLLADRRTTRETAGALFLSPKTVEYHLRSVYRKLGISSRDELVAAMERSRWPR
jgi:DNA-binding CsgD family transcriptional regulator